MDEQKRTRVILLAPQTQAAEQELFNKMAQALSPKAVIKTLPAIDAGKLQRYPLYLFGQAGLVEQAQLQVTSMPPLAELLAQPASKKNVWQQLKQYKV